MKVFWLKIALSVMIGSFLINIAAYAQEDTFDRSQQSIAKKIQKNSIF